jgi:hypothetical protein
MNALGHGQPPRFNLAQKTFISDQLFWLIALRVTLDRAKRGFIEDDGAIDVAGALLIAREILDGVIDRFDSVARPGSADPSPSHRGDRA